MIEILKTREEQEMENMSELQKLIHTYEKLSKALPSIMLKIATKNITVKQLGVVITLYHKNQGKLISIIKKQANEIARSNEENAELKDKLKKERNKLKEIQKQQK
jgi:hypothetical protein